MERLLEVSKELSLKIENNEVAAGELLRQAESLQQELKAMRQYRESLEVMNGQQQSRVHLPQIELGYIRQLQQDNGDLRTLLEEHQAALQMIMSKYRQQVGSFLDADDTSLIEDNHLSKELQHRTDQVYHMAAVMYQAAKAEDNSVQSLTETIARLEYENRTLRELVSQPLAANKPLESCDSTNISTAP